MSSITFVVVVGAVNEKVLTGSIIVVVGWRPGFISHDTSRLQRCKPETREKRIKIGKPQEKGKHEKREKMEKKKKRGNN